MSSTAGLSASEIGRELDHKAAEAAQAVVLDQMFFSLDAAKFTQFTAVFDAPPGPGFERLVAVKPGGASAAWAVQPRVKTLLPIPPAPASPPGGLTQNNVKVSGLRTMSVAAIQAAPFFSFRTNPLRGLEARQPRRS